MGETAKFTAKVVTHGPELQVKYNWRVSEGNILSGQGTSSIEVERPPSSTLVATVDIAGTPDDSHCPRSHSEMVRWDAPAECPTIAVYGPAGIVQPGDLATFTLRIDDSQKFGRLEYEWTVEGGELVEGQGTGKIQVRYSDLYTKLTASIRIKGFPDVCTNTAAELYQIGCILPVTLLIDEFGRLANGALETRLKKFYVELANNPNNQGYIIVYGTENEMAARERFIVKSVNFRNFDRSRITIVRGGTHPSGKVYTKLYRVPPGAENPAP